VNAGDNITSNPLKLFKALKHFPQMVAYFISTSILIEHNFFIARSEPRAARLYIAHNSRFTVHASRFSRLTPHEDLTFPILSLAKRLHLIYLSFEISPSHWLLTHC
jgi:hypothetical protein